MRIVQVVTQMEAGGAQRVAFLLTEALRNRGHEVELWFLYIKRPAYTSFPGVKALLEHKPSGLDYIKIAIKLWSLLRAYKPDALITHTYYANVLGQSMAKVCGILTRIAVQHNPLSTYPKIASWVDWVLGTTNVYSANVAVSQAVVESAVQYLAPYRKKLTKIYNGVPYQESENSPRAVRTRWGLPENAPLLLNVGRLARQKNQGILFEALLHIPEAHMVLIGDGELKDCLQEKVAELRLENRVHLLGELKSQDVLALLSVSNVFVFPSLYEAMPMALVEAMGAGLPVVASNIAAIREVLDDAGILVSSDSAEEIARAVQQILESPEVTCCMRERSLERARLFSLQKMVNSYEELLA